MGRTCFSWAPELSDVTWVLAHDKHYNLHRTTDNNTWKANWRKSGFFFVIDDLILKQIIRKICTFIGFNFFSNLFFFAYSWIFVIYAENIRRGVRQGCVMSPDLFNMYSEIILGNWKMKMDTSGWSFNHKY